MVAMNRYNINTREKEISLSDGEYKIEDWDSFQSILIF